MSKRSIAIANPTLKTLVAELASECLTVMALINQLQLPHLSSAQQAEILAELLAAAIHLHSHYDQDFQTLVADAIETLPSAN